MNVSPFEADIVAALHRYWLPPQAAASQQPTTEGPVVIATDADLDAYLLETFGVVLPNVQVCPTHATPWRAFHDAYFARSPVSVWKASRGMGGKSFTLSLLALVEAITLRADVNILGGSGEQSKRVLESMGKLWAASTSPRQFLLGEPSGHRTRFIFGNVINALMASQASVRGPHPQRLRLDEIDEMNIDILNSAMGQPMNGRGILSQTVLSSTHQYPDGTMTTILKRAGEKGWPVFEWCWKETAEPHGWLTHEQVARKRLEVTTQMWENEYDLQEPSAEGRAFVTEKIDAMFDATLGEVPGDLGVYYEFEAPDPRGRYATGADWARKKDCTEIGTLRVDVLPMRLVAYERMNRLPWPVMVARFDARLKRFGGSGTHDGTGLGDVVHSLIEGAAEAFLMVGRPRQDLLSNYVRACEAGEIRAPRVASIYSAHKFATYDELYGTGHLPDPVSMMALAYRAASSGGFLEYARQQVAQAQRADEVREAEARAAADPSPAPTVQNPWFAALPSHVDRGDA